MCEDPNFGNEEDAERVSDADRGKGAPDHLGLARTLRRQGAIDCEQLRQLGFTDGIVRRLVARGALTRRHRGVYVDGCAPLTQRTHLCAAQLALGPTAFFSHRTAAALLGLRAMNVRALELTVVSGHTPRHQGLQVHRTREAPAAAELRTRDGLRHSSFARMLIELAPRETAAELDRLIAEGARRRLLDLEKVDAALARRTRTRGESGLIAALERYRPPDNHARSGFERDFAAWLATLPGIPAPQRNVRLEDRWEIDFFWPQQRLALETDGSEYHRTPAELERDRIKDAWLQCRDIRVLRVTDFRFDHDRAGIHGDLRGLLARS